MNYQNAKKTKIVCTIGPATRKEEKILALYEAGMNVVRLNFSHKDYEEKKMVADIVHRLNAEGKTNLTIALDTKGPEIRTGKLAQAIVYEKGEVLIISTDINDNGIDKMLYCDYPYIIQDISVGDIIRIESGLMDCEVLDILDDKHISVKALASTTIKSYRHINLPGIRLRLPGFTTQDKEDVIFGIQNNFDVIFMSFVRNKDNLIEARRFLDENGGKYISIYSKIENQEGIDNIDEIIEHSDGIMIARGDLGVEVPVYRLPVYQDIIISKCNEAGKPVIMATQLMESMMEESFPTRAEVSDVYHSITSGVDMIMTSGETALGEYAIECVGYMSQIAIEAESIRNQCNDKCCIGSYHHIHMQDKLTGGCGGICEGYCACGDGGCGSHDDMTTTRSSYRSGSTYPNDEYNNRYPVELRNFHKGSIADSAIELASNIGASAFVCFTKRGYVALMASMNKSAIPIYAFTSKQYAIKQMNMMYGVYPQYIDFDTPGATSQAFDLLKSQGHISTGDFVVLFSDTRHNEFGAPSIHIVQVD